MTLDRRREAEQLAVRALTKQEIDRRIQGLIEEVAPLRERRADVDIDPADALRPCWIEPSELVRRLRRFLVYN